MIRKILNKFLESLPTTVREEKLRIKYFSMEADLAEQVKENESLNSRLSYEYSARARVKWYQRDEYNEQIREHLSKRILRELVLGENVDPFDQETIERLRRVATYASTSTHRPIQFSEGMCPHGFVTLMELRIPEIVLRMEGPK